MPIGSALVLTGWITSMSLVRTPVIVLESQFTTYSDLPSGSILATLLSPFSVAESYLPLPAMHTCRGPELTPLIHEPLKVRRSMPAMTTTTAMTTSSARRRRRYWRLV